MAPSNKGQVFFKGNFASRYTERKKNPQGIQKTAATAERINMLFFQ